MADLEDGELPSDDENEADQRIEQTGISTAAPNPTEQIPLSRRAVPGLSSDDSSSDSDDSDVGGKSQSKKKKVAEMDTGGPQAASSFGSAPARRVNNVWSNVIQEQTLSHTMVGLGVDKLGAELQMDRDVESYDFTLAKTDTRPHTAKLIKTEAHDPFDKLIDHDNFGDASRRGTKRRWTSKHSKARHHRPESKEQSSEPVDLTEEESKIVSNIIAELDEPNEQLFGRIVKVLGEEKCLELLEATRLKEANGGILTFNEDRRRTPGGVFIFLLKQDPGIERVKWREIFIDDYNKRNAENKSRKRRNRKKRQRKPVDLADEIKECLEEKAAELKSQLEDVPDQELEMESTEIKIEHDTTEVKTELTHTASNGELNNYSTDKVEVVVKMEQSELNSDVTQNGADLELDVSSEPILL